MNKKNHLSLSSSKKLLFFVVFSLSMFGTTQSVRADMWGANLIAATYKQAAEELATHLRDVLVGVAKQAVARVMNTQISMMIGGGNGHGVQFIANWQTFLVADPQKQANAYMNDFFSATTRGRNSSSNYKPVQAPACEYKNGTISDGCAPRYISVLSNDQKKWFAQEGIIPVAQAAVPALQNADVNTVNAYDKNFYKYQTDSAKTAINPSTPNVDLMNYVRSPSEIFNGGNWRGFNAFFNNPANNPAGYSLLAKDAYQNKISQEQRKADVQAVAYQGFKAAVGSDGVTVKTPGITIAQLVDKVQGFSLDSLSSAQGVGALIQSMATTVVNAVVTKGLSAANEAVAQNTGINLGLNANSLANIDWNNSGSGQSAEFNNGMNNFNTDVQSGLSNGSQEWGNMNFASGSTTPTNASNQDSLSPLDSINFQSQQTTTPVNSGTSTFIPDTTWSAPQTQQSKDPLWVPQSGN